MNKILRLVVRSVFEDRLVVVAPGVAYFMMLGLMPGVAALILVFSLVADPAEVQRQFAELRPAVPQEAAELLTAQMARIAEERVAAGWGLVLSILVTLWAGSYALGVIVAALNIAFATEETRGWIRITVLRLVLTVGGVVMGILAIGVLILVPLTLDFLEVTGTMRSVLSFVRWPILLFLWMAGLSLLYQLAPDRKPPRVRPLTWGAASTAVLWVLASSLFSLYAGRLDVYQDFLGAFAAVVILMLWLLITAFAMLLGAEVDAAVDRVRAERAAETETAGS